MAAGWIYILTNKSAPGLVKVGLTTTSPKQRLKELSGATGVPEEFDLFDALAVSNVREAESKAHSVLERAFGRPNPSREFFSASPEDTLEVLKGALQIYLEESDAQELLNATKLVRQKSFSLGVIEFETYFKSATKGSEYYLNENLAGFYGVYIAACAATSRIPIYPHFIASHPYSSKIAQTAIEVASAFTDSPESLIIDFLRSHRV